jgi:DNA polymerase III alpha subunit (gram-positive type)
MLLCAYDIETTGLDREKSLITEIGLCLYSTEQNRILESAGFLVQPVGVPITPQITELTGITQSAVDRFGYTQGDAVQSFFDFADQADAIIGHNSNSFDLPIIQNSAKRTGLVLPEKLSIDTMTDIPGVKGEQLITMCAKAGFVYEAHGALPDAMAVLKLAAFHANSSANRSFAKIVERAKSPLVVLQSHQSRQDNAAAKQAKFRWNDPLKGWFRIVKEIDIPDLQFSIRISRADKDIFPVWD